jgi:hypothetical protein
MNNVAIVLIIDKQHNRTFTWNGFLLNILKSILSSFVNGPWYFKIENQIKIQCRMKMKDLQSSSSDPSAQSAFRRNADPCGNIRQSYTTRIH